jgi:hypothetical protein
MSSNAKGAIGQSMKERGRSSGAWSEKSSARETEIYKVWEEHEADPS